MDDYDDILLIGEGTYGKVYKAKDKTQNLQYAIKKVEIDKDHGFPFTTIREIRMLKKLKHPNIVNLANVFIKKDDMYIVMEYLPFDLSALLQSKFIFTDEHIKSLSYQLINAVKFIHSFDLIHRDIKSSNILIDKNGTLKLADFGLTRKIGNQIIDYNSGELYNCMTNRVCTLWYRAPELLLGSTDYGLKVDSWSIGCVILEMKMRKIAFKGQDEIDQVNVVFEMLGMPKENYRWSEMFNIDKYKKNKPWMEILKDAFGQFFDDMMLDFVGHFIDLSPRARILPSSALKLDILKNYENIKIPIEIEDVHDYYSKEKRKKADVTIFD